MIGLSNGVKRSNWLCFCSFEFVFKPGIALFRYTLNTIISSACIHIKYLTLSFSWQEPFSPFIVDTTPSNNVVMLDQHIKVHYIFLCTSKRKGFQDTKNQIHGCMHILYVKYIKYTKLMSLLKGNIFTENM